jgi:hypothetical protein
VALTTHPHVAPSLKKEYSSTSTQPLCLHGMSKVNLFTFLPFIIIVIIIIIIIIINALANKEYARWFTVAILRLIIITFF